MIEYQLVGMDLGEVRFAISPINEVSLSLRTFRDPGRYPLHLPWLQMTAEPRDALHIELLTALTNTDLWTPDFLHPRPHSPMTTFHDELDLIASTPGAIVRSKLAEVHGDDLPPVLAGRPDRVLKRIVRALDAYWNSCWEPWWPRMRSVLEADITYRGRVVAQRGMAAMFADLSPRVSLVDDVVRVRTKTHGGYRRTTRGAGLALIPSMFSRGGSTPITAEQEPQIMYAARGVGTLWETDRGTPPDAVANLIGEVRASLLDLLASPSSTTELAHRLRVTPTAVNQHLRAMRDAGLLTSSRHGRSVLYLRSELGDRLISSAG
ncbi:DNA-binding transcriptional ArsR family regulator [Nocardioides daedukensis]|uniref:DNA-binding transcriptional ArsR family regulator n=1 Tax=Nocardioides daedukensis TaxID=634462 RepID=A0A7Y9RXD7_9ACTN|nr:DUF5937 family protein [Nocardioides daedukensis]NYG58431.1 DNA-binding transcriptional ArsR family regulator [Nocardioides daedukensis]